MEEMIFIEQAVRLAQVHSRDGIHGPFGAVIVKDGRVIAEGWNRVVETNDPTAHAEIVAIRRACASLNTFSLSGCTIYCSCEPCPMCLAAIYWARIAHVVYAATGQEAAAAGFDDVYILDELKKCGAERSIKFVHLRTASAHRVLADWAYNQNKVPY